MARRVTSGFLTLLLSVTLIVFAPGGSNQRVASASESSNTAEAPQLKISGFDQVGPYPVGIKSASFRDWDSYLNPPLGYSERSAGLWVCDMRLGENASPVESGFCKRFYLAFHQKSRYTAGNRNDTLNQVREHIKSLDSVVDTYKIFLIEQYSLAGLTYFGISDPITIFSHSPRVVGRVLETTVYSNFYYARRELVGLDVNWYSCSKFFSKPQRTVPRVCTPIAGVSSNVDEVSLENREYLGRHLALRITGDGGTIEYFSKTTGAVRLAQAQIDLSPVTQGENDSLELEAPVGKTYKVTLRTGETRNFDGIYRCPNNASVSIKNLVSGRIIRKNLRLSRNDDYMLPCFARLNISVQANMKVQVELPSTYWNSKSTESFIIKGEPALSASAPKRAFDSYVLRLNANRPVSTTCNVREEYFSFGGDLIATKWFSVSLRYGYATKKRTTYYVGVIRAMVTCKSTSKYGVAIDTYKVFSY